MGLYLLTKKVTRDGTFEGAVQAMAGVPEYKRGSTPKTCTLCQTGQWWYPPGTIPYLSVRLGRLGRPQE